MYLDFDAAREASRKGFEQICLNGDWIGRADRDGRRSASEHFAGIGNAYGEWRWYGSKEFVTEDFGPVITFGSPYSDISWQVLGNIEVTRTYCMEVSSHIEVKILHPNTGWEVIVPPARSIVTVPVAVGKGGDFKIFVRCPRGDCAPPPLAGPWIPGLLIRAVRLDFDSLSEDSMTRYWTNLEATRVEELESILRQILANWLEWLDRVERDHPVFESETVDLQRQCERAEMITAELDSIGATDYPEWFDVCDEP